VRRCRTRMQRPRFDHVTASERITAIRSRVTAPEKRCCFCFVGLNLYVASGITKMGITELTIAVWPWLLMMLLFLRLVTYWPAMSLWLPHRMVR